MLSTVFIAGEQTFRIYNDGYFLIFYYFSGTVIKVFQENVINTERVSYIKALKAGRGVHPSDLVQQHDTIVIADLVIDSVVFIIMCWFVAVSADEKKGSSSIRFHNFSRKESIPEDEIILRERSYDYKHRYCGHCNTTTDIKEANFFGRSVQTTHTHYRLHTSDTLYLCYFTLI